MTDIEMLKKLTGESDDELLSILLQMSEEKLLTLTGRTKMIEQLLPAKRDWALIAYNRIGTEGEASRSGGGISSSFIEIPKDIESIIFKYRIARVSGHAHEKNADKTILPEEEEYNKE